MFETDEIERVLFDEAALKATVARVGAEIDRDFAGVSEPLLLLGVLKGSVIFYADLARAVNHPVNMEFVKISSYGSSTVSSGTPTMQTTLSSDAVKGRHIIVVEDIVDSGRSLSLLSRHLKELGAASVRCCTLLDKKSRRQVDFTPDYIGIDVPDLFVVGYGLDFDERFRSLPFIGVLKEEAYSK